MSVVTGRVSTWGQMEIYLAPGPNAFVTSVLAAFSITGFPLEGPNVGPKYIDFSRFTLTIQRLARAKKKVDLPIMVEGLN